VSVRSDFGAAMSFQERFKPRLVEIIRLVTRVEVASWEDDAKRNTDFLVARMTNDYRVTARVRQAEYAERYGNQFTIRLDRPSRVPTEMDKMRAGFGDFGVYAFESEPGSNDLAPWVLYNTALLREYLDEGGRWYLQHNADGSSDFAAFDIAEVGGVQLGFVLNSKGLDIDAWPPPLGICSICGHPTWRTDANGQARHECCSRLVSGFGCLACDTSSSREHARWGWPS
jgi:hypothetical protein